MMLRCISRLGPIGLCATMPLSISENIDKKIVPKFDNPEYKKNVQEESGWKRLQDMFYVDEFGNISRELNSVLQATILAAFCGTCYGGWIRSRNAYISFMESNQATIFETPLDAKSKLQSKVSIAFGKGAFQWGWRLSIFTFGYCGITTAISVYRGKSSMYEYMTGGLITGAIYKMSLGLRGSIIGGTLGLLLGTMAGAVTLLMLRITGTTVEETRYWQYQFRANRKRAEDRRHKSNSEALNDPIVLYHDAAVEVTKPGLENFNLEDKETKSDIPKTEKK